MLIILPKQINERIIKRYSNIFLFFSTKIQAIKKTIFTSVVMVPTSILLTCEIATFNEFKLLTPISAFIVKLIPNAATI